MNQKITELNGDNKLHLICLFLLWDCMTWPCLAMDLFSKVELQHNAFSSVSFYSC